jgi:hypothetical protein
LLILQIPFYSRFMICQSYTPYKLVFKKYKCYKYPIGSVVSSFFMIFENDQRK